MITARFYLMTTQSKISKWIEYYTSGKNK